MPLPKPKQGSPNPLPTSKMDVWDRASTKLGLHDGQYVVGFMTSGTYSLPSCRIRAGRHEELQLFHSTTAATAAGLRPCRTCRPDRYYLERSDGSASFVQLRNSVLMMPGDYPCAASLLKDAALSALQLDHLIQDHAHMRVDQWLTRLRVRHAAKCLIDGRQTRPKIALDAGFADSQSFRRDFLAQMRIAPEEYPPQRERFSLSLPYGYRATEILSYHGRDQESASERREGNRILKTLAIEGYPLVLELTVEATQAAVRVHTDRTLDPASFPQIHEAALGMLGLRHPAAAFEREHPQFVRPRRGLHLPLLPTVFDALVWAIIGQQINLKFAASLRREIVNLVGRPVGSMRVHPTPEAVAGLDTSALTSRRFSRSKAKYLIGAAQAIVNGDLALEGLIEGSAVVAERDLTALNGIGTWTARYVMLRSGFADAAPVGDSGLATALQRHYQLVDRPDTRQSARLMSIYAPYRSLATMHLWTSLQETARCSRVSSSRGKAAAGTTFQIRSRPS